MKKIAFITILFCVTNITTSYAQIMVTKLLGKDGSKTELGYGAFGYYEFPLNSIENKSIKIELFDFSIFPKKANYNDTVTIGYISIKLGYKHVFSETKSGFYLEPQVGWCRVVTSFPPFYTTDVPPASKDGLALALEGGYRLEVGQNGNTFDFGLKYESDIAGTNYTASSIGFRISYSFHLFRKKDSY